MGRGGDTEQAPKGGRLGFLVRYLDARRVLHDRKIYPLRTRLTLGVLANLVLLAATYALLMGMSGHGPAVTYWWIAAIFLTEPFLWNLWPVSRLEPGRAAVAYLSVAVLNMLVLLAFFTTHHGGYPQTLYFLLVLSVLDSSVGTPAFSRAIPIVLLLGIRQESIAIPLAVGLAVALSVVIREIRAFCQERQGTEQLERLNMQVRQAKDEAHTDALTQLYNRHIIPDRVEGLLSYCRGSRLPFGMLLVDIDHLKDANDRHGHAFGDEVIAHVSTLVAGILRSDDFAIRYGGDELLLVTTDVQESGQIAALAERIRSGMGRLPLGDFHVTLSIGYVLYPVTDVRDFADGFAKADRALYEAKRRGRDQAVDYAAMPKDMPLPRSGRTGMAGTKG